MREDLTKDERDFVEANAGELWLSYFSNDEIELNVIESARKLAKQGAQPEEAKNLQKAGLASRQEIAKRYVELFELLRDVAGAVETYSYDDEI